MKKRSADALDKLLQQWGNRTVPDATHRRELEMRVMRNTRECLHAHANAATSDKGSLLRWPGIVGWVTLGAVAAALVMAVLTWQLDEGKIAPPQVANDHSKVSPFSPEQIAARKLLFGEMDDLFAGTLRWVSLTDDGLQFDLGTDPVRAETSPVALRTVVSKRSADGQNWVTVWQADVMIAPDEYVSLARPELSMPTLGLWVHRLPDGAYVVHADIGDAGNASGSQMLPFFPGGDAVQTVCLDSGGDKYRLSQSLAELSKGSG